jgi:hypothetical protein
MPFDMYANGQHEAIEHHEEFIFALAQADAPRFPALSSLWDAYYDDPRISAAQASALLHELIALLASHGGTANKALTNTVVRLLPFFSMACRGGHEITTQSD